MKQTIFIITILTFFNSTFAQQEAEYAPVKPLAYEIGLVLSSPQKPRQIFIVEVQNANYDLYQVVYFPETDGLRGGVTKFIRIDTLNNKTVWKLNLRKPSKDEKFYCRTDNFLENESTNKTSLRFRSTQFDAFIQFKNFSEIPCMVLYKELPTKMVNN